ncbi:MAG: hypothetical protein KAR20_13135, partial [Candidatus Heimdallarchaeota archaeon]|nr:hypothetical protein [Candidatus Heimdallarchaeota archaeon]
MSKISIGIRKEDKNKWERRTPIIPEDLGSLLSDDSLEFIVESSDNRAYEDSDFEKQGATISPNLKNARFIFGIKEIPVKYIEPKKIYIFFSHTIKGQEYNMPLLKKIINSKATLIDYEVIRNDKGKRLIFFGNWAGFAGMNDTLWTYGQRLLLLENVKNPFTVLKRCYMYKDFEDEKEHFRKVGEIIKEEGLEFPIICGFAGYGNVSTGAQTLFDILPSIELDPSELGPQFQINSLSKHHVYKVVFKEEHIVEPIDPNMDFDLQDYYNHGTEKYQSIFSKYLPYLTILINGNYWTKKYPRLITKKEFLGLIEKDSRLKVIGDLSCDIDGAIQGTIRETEPDKPFFTYHPKTDSASYEFTSSSIPIMAVDN